MIRVISRTTFGTALAAIVSLSACSGTGTPSGPVPSTHDGASSDAHATFVVHWPTAQPSTSARHRDAISVSTASITVSVDGSAPYIVNKPTLSGSPSSTSVTIDAPIGTDSMTFIAWDQPGGVGNVLDKATTSQTIVANTNNTVGVTLDGVCASLLPNVSTAASYSTSKTTSVTLAAGGTQTILSSLRLVGPFAETVSVNEVDADGNTLLASAQPEPITLSESGPTPHVVIAPSSTSAGNTKFTLTPIAAEPDSTTTTVTATSQSCGSGSAAFRNSFTLSSSAILYVADSVAGIIAYDQDGTQVAKIATTAGVTGLAYNSKSASLVAVEPTSATTGGITFQSLSLTGSSLGSGKVTPSVQNPVGNIAYNPADGYFLMAMRYYTDTSKTTHYGTVLEYTISASTATAINPTGTHPFQQSSTAPPPYDPNSFAVLPGGTVIVGDQQATSFVYDQNGNYLNLSVAASENTLAIDTLRGNVLVFDGTQDGPVYSESTLTDNENFYYPYDGGATFNAAAYNQGTDELYGFESNVSFAIPMTSSYAVSTIPNSNLPANAFTGLSAPTQAVLLP